MDLRSRPPARRTRASGLQALTIPPPADLSIAIVSFNTQDWLRKTLLSIFTDTKNVRLDVWVIDNASSDGSPAMVQKEFPQVRLIQNKTNEFITKPYNRVFKESTSRYVLIADSDLLYLENAIGKMVQYMDEHPDMGALSPKILRSNGDVDLVYNRDNTLKHAFLNRTILAKVLPSAARTAEEHFQYKGWDRLSSREIDSADVCLICRQEAIRQVGVYDEHLRLYFTQNDLCLRLRKKGWRVYYWAEAAIVHERSQSVGRVSFKTISDIYRGDMFHFYRQWNPAWKVALFVFLNKTTAALLGLAVKLGLYKPKANLIYGIEGSRN